MAFALHPDFRLQKLKFGSEQAPLVVIDNFVADPDSLVDLAAAKQFGDVTSYYPGVRAKVPLTYQQFVIERLREVCSEYFGLDAGGLRFTACHFSLVTTPSASLIHMQRIPHVDSLFANQLAFIHYLFKGDLGGTSFYRHRKTRFESIDHERKAEYLRQVELEAQGPDTPPAEYINGDSPLYERLATQEGVFNRLLLYRRNSLHSGAIAKNFVPDPNPRTGRLSINGFLA
jgi:hypothetical protein